MRDDAGDARKTTAAATSPGVPRRPNGILDITHSRNSGLAKNGAVIGYEITSIPGLVMATHRALWTYSGSVAPEPVPDTWT